MTKENKKSLILGASSNEERYSYKCLMLLQEMNIDCIGVGNRKGKIGNIDIETIPTYISDIDTICMYLGAKHQKTYYDYIVSLNPNRILFPPGTENPELEDIAKKEGIYTEKACPLVMLKTNNY